MIKVLDATCENGQVKVGTLSITGVTILSEGVGSSVGLLIIDGSESYYVAKTSPDLDTTLAKISSALDNIATALSTIDAKPVGGTGSAPAPGAASQISQIQSLKTEIDTLKGDLR